MSDANSQVAEFWSSLGEAVDATAVTPQRRTDIIAAHLEGADDSYYVLKDPIRKNYIRLSESDYALWWQMDGQKSVKDLLFYNLMRYRSLPIGHLKNLVASLRQNYFLEEEPTGIYDQLRTALEASAPASQGRKILNAFLHTELDINGLEDFFTPLYRQTKWLFSTVMQILFMLVILGGGWLFASIFFSDDNIFSGTNSSVGTGVISLFIANLFVIFIHELAHGLTTKHWGRELNRGGFLIYWGFPAFFVDTRDTWLSPRLHRVLVSWAGPHSGLILGGIAGGLLTIINSDFYTNEIDIIWVRFIYHVGFLAYFSVIINLNPLLELDGYFMLMDWLEMPGLRQRAIRFWREEMLDSWRQQKKPIAHWQEASRTERIFTVFGALTLVYSTYALYIALVFWNNKLWPFAVTLWEGGGWGRWLLLLVTAVLVIPGIYYIIQFIWSRLQAGLEWLARRDLLARPDVLALIIGIPIVLGLPALFVYLENPIVETLLLWLLHIGIIMTMIGIARQLPGSRFQWAIVSLAIATIALAIAWVGTTDLFTVPPQSLRQFSLIIFGIAITATGIISYTTVAPAYLQWQERLFMVLLMAVGGVFAFFFYTLGVTLLISLFIIFPVFLGLMLLVPLLINFRRSTFALPWGLLTLSILVVPWLLIEPDLHTAVAVLWFFAGLLYLLLGALSEFKRHEDVVVNDAAMAGGVFGERQRLVVSFNHFMSAFFASYETIFGGRRLADIQTQMYALGPINHNDTIFEVGHKIRNSLLLAVDRLDDLAGTPFTRKAGQAAYDSLPWLEAETLGRHVLAAMEWGSQLAQGFIRARDSRENLVRQADIFSGFDQDGIEELLRVGETTTFRVGATIARANMDATYFHLIESGEVAVVHNGLKMATLDAGGYFGILALQAEGDYMQTYRAETAVILFTINRDRFDPLLRADTTLARQVSSGNQSRDLLKRMLLFSSLSPQEIATIDARLTPRTVKSGEVIVQQNQPRSHLIIVANGQLEIVNEDENGRERILGTLGQGEHFGEYELFANTPYSATCRATMDSKLLLLDEPKFDELVLGSERMSHYVEQIGSGRLIASRRKLGVSALIS